MGRFAFRTERSARLSSIRTTNSSNKTRKEFLRHALLFRVSLNGLFRSLSRIAAVWFEQCELTPVKRGNQYGEGAYGDGSYGAAEGEL